MLPSAGYFSEIDCPYFDTGGCSRPHCHFKHPKSETSASQPPVKQALSQKDIGDLIKLASDAVSALQQAGVLSGTPENDDSVVEIPPPTPKSVPVQQPVPTYNPTPKAVLHKLHNLAAYHPSLIRTPSAPIKRPSTSETPSVPKRPKVLQEREKDPEVNAQHSWDKIYRLSPEPDWSNKGYSYFAPNQNNQVSSSTSPNRQAECEQAISSLPIGVEGSISEDESAKFSEESSEGKVPNEDVAVNEEIELVSRDENEELDSGECVKDKQEDIIIELDISPSQGKDVKSDNFTKTSNEHKGSENDKKRKHREEESDHKKGSDKDCKRNRTKHRSDSHDKGNSKNKHRDSTSKSESDKHRKGSSDSRNRSRDSESYRYGKKRSKSDSSHKKSGHSVHKDKEKNNSESEESSKKKESNTDEEQSASDSSDNGDPKQYNRREEDSSPDNDDHKKYDRREEDSSPADNNQDISSISDSDDDTESDNKRESSKNTYSCDSKKSEKRKSSKSDSQKRKSASSDRKKEDSGTAHKSSSSKHRSDEKKSTNKMSNHREQSSSEIEGSSLIGGSGSEKYSGSHRKHKTNRHHSEEKKNSRDHSTNHRSRSSDVKTSNSKHRSDRSSSKHKSNHQDKKKSKDHHSSSNSRRHSSSSHHEDKHKRKDSSKQRDDGKHMSSKDKSQSRRNESTKSSDRKTKTKENQEPKKSHRESKSREKQREKSSGGEHKRKDSSGKSSKEKSSSEKPLHHAEDTKSKTTSEVPVSLPSPLHSETTYSSWVSSTEEPPKTEEEEEEVTAANETPDVETQPVQPTDVASSSEEEEEVADSIKLPSDLGESSCDSELERECYEIYKTYEPTVVPTKQTSETPTKSQEPELLAIGKKRVAHKGLENAVIPPINVNLTNPRPKLNPKQMILDRIRKVKESQAAEENAAQQQQGTSRVRIAHVANVPLLLSAKNKVEKWLNTCQKNPNPVSKTIPLIRPPLPNTGGTFKPNIFPSIPRTPTIAQTAPKHGRRIAHKPPTDILVRPIIAEAGGKIPVSIRQNYLNILVDEYLKLCPTQKEAFDKAVQEELAIYNRSSTRLVYSNLMPNMINRLRKSALNQAGKAGASQRVQSHTSILAGMDKKPKGSWSIEKIKKPPTKSLYEEMSRYIMTEEELKTNGYPCAHPEEKGLAVFHVMPKKAVSSSDSLQRVCVRCNTTYYVNKQGFPLKKEQCIYHWGRAHQTKANGIWESQYSCCHGGSDDTGCTLAACHVSETFDPKDMRGFVKTLSREEAPADGNYGMYALDCEMCYTTFGLELTRVTVIGMDLETVYETLVKPRRAILDYNTHFSGIKEEDLANVTTSIYDVQSVLLSLFSDKTILLGHSLESDFKALKLIHSTVVDTSVVFPHRDGPPKKRALKTLCRERLQKIIQESEGGHDSAEDAKACMELMLHKIKEDKKS